ncbi:MULTISPECIES: hypothetical protein [Bradyrhizobium]|nr:MULTISPECIES: hypothetical protein [Bradyrhizobium]
MSDIANTPMRRRIRVLNDFFRATFMGGKIVITAGGQVCRST